MVLNHKLYGSTCALAYPVLFIIVYTTSSPFSSSINLPSSE